MRRWWADPPRETYPDDELEKYRARVRGDDRLTEIFFIRMRARPIGFIQSYRIDDHDEYGQALALEASAAGIDLFIGEPELIGKGLGPAAIRAFLRDVVFARYDVAECVIGPSVKNTSAIRAYEKAGFAFMRDVKVPDEPDPEHLMRIARQDVFLQSAAVPGSPIRKELLLDTIRRDRERFDALIAGIPRERLERPDSAADGWSVKDVLWHIAWGDRQGEGMIRARALEGSGLWQLFEDERNAAVVSEGRAKALDEVLSEYGASYRDFMSALGRLTDAELNEPERWQGLVEAAPGWLPWRILYDPHHYEVHGRWIQVRSG